jgi:CDP-glucose 4,6-dehydratase
MAKRQSTMENLVGYKLFKNIYYGKRVLITGHTGFKGSWLAFWLKLMGAEVIGYSLESPTQPNHFSLLNLDIVHLIGDILDEEKLDVAFKTHNPEIVFHLAAQPLVRQSFNDPILTYKTNVIGTLNVFEACRKTPSVKVIINVTSDKCYLNKEWIWGYRESDEMGGYDLYSSSKGCSEILTQSYRNSFFNFETFQDHGVSLASVRAGNVIGGGDWAQDRLIPDIVRAISQNQVVYLRNPKAVRPWQHVLEPLSGYLLLASELSTGKNEYADGWNFGPSDGDAITVEDVVKSIKNNWADLKYEIKSIVNQPHEATQLKLDCSKAVSLLLWKPIWNSKKTFNITTEWYKKYYLENKILTRENIFNFINDAIDNNTIWTK